MFSLEKAMFGIPIHCRNLSLALSLCLALLLTLPRATAGMFGISIPANYGKWFTQIHQLYLENQDLIANARKLYVAYVTVSNTIDALEGLNQADKGVFKDRWRRNMRVLLEANIWWELDACVFDGEPAVNTLLQQLLGLQFGTDGRVTVAPETIQTIGLALFADPEHWATLFRESPVPAFPTWLVTDHEFTFLADNYLYRQETWAFRDFRKQLQGDMTQRIFWEIANHPTRYLRCAGRDPCWSPFNLDGTATVTWSWPEMLTHMYRLEGPLHQPLPLEGELIYGDLHLVDYEAYLHRRVCAAVWRAMGVELKQKITLARNAFRKRCHDLEATLSEVGYLARFLQNSITVLDSWESGSSGGAMAVATALSITAGGEADRQGKFQSFIEGLIGKKIDIALERAREVKERIRETDAIFADLLAQIEAAARGHRVDRTVDGLIRADVGRLVSGFTRNRLPPHAYLSSPYAFETLSAKIADTFQE